MSKKEKPSIDSKKKGSKMAKKFYFNNFINQLSAEELSDILRDMLVEEDCCIASEHLGELREKTF